MPTSIVLVSCLADFYGKVREVLAQSYIDRIEKAGPVPLIETRTADEARLIIAKRLQQDARGDGADPTLYLRPAVLRGVRRPVDPAHPGAGADAHARAGGRRDRSPSAEPEKVGLHLDAGGRAGLRRRAARRSAGVRPRRIEFREHWDRFTAQSEAEIPSDDQALMDVLAGALALAREEWGGAVDVTVQAARAGR